MTDFIIRTNNKQGAVIVIVCDFGWLGLVSDWGFMSFFGISAMYVLVTAAWI